MLKGSKEQEPKPVEEFEKTSETSARTSPNWMMTSSVQPGRCKSNAILRMCDWKRFHVYRKLKPWSALNRSSRAGERGRSIGGIEKAGDLSHVGAESSRR